MNLSRETPASEPPAGAEADRLRRLILAETHPLRPPLTPELEMLGADDYAAIWSATEAELEAMRLPPPFWAFAWPGGQALARHLLDRPETVAGRSVLAIAAGGGLEAIAAARGGARRVVANDVDPAALVAAELNAARNGVALEICGADLIADPGTGRLDPREADLILLGDALYERPLAARILARLAEAAQAGATALIADAGRGCLTETGALADGAQSPPLTEIARYEVPVPEALEDRPSRLARVWRLAPGGR